MATKVEDRIETKALLRLASINTVTLHYWIYLGLLPHWDGRYFEGQGGSRYVYPPGAVDLARKIKAWREQSIPYRQIRELLRAEGAEL
ncbi:unnamed protein product [marine sediment metagenome]|uniref:HTH merR-type domain-containing protein n=1 Tax=marine sediment metagenome TaxID=412755 RepID=X1SFS2_9ZZZZ